MKTAILLTLLAMISSTTVRAGGREGEEPLPQSNASFLQSIVADAVHDFFREYGREVSRDSIAVTLVQSGDSWIAENAIISTLSSTGCRIFLSDSTLVSTGLQLTVTGLSLGTSYDDMSRDGFLGTKRVRRTARVAFDARLIRHATGELLLSRSFARSSADTVAVDDIPGLEIPGLPATRGVIPDGPFLDKIIEPLVILGATGTAILLLFKIRS